MGEKFNNLGIAIMLPPTPDGNMIIKPFELPKEATTDLKLNNTDNVLIEDAVILD